MEIKIGSLTQWWFFSNAFSSINEFSWIKFIGLVLYRPTNWAEFVKRWRLKFNISISVSRKRETKKCSTVSIYVQMFGNVIYFVFILHCFESVNVIIWPSTQSCWLMYLSASSKLFQLNQNHDPFKAPIARCMYEIWCTVRRPPHWKCPGLRFTQNVICYPVVEMHIKSVCLRIYTYKYIFVFESAKNAGSGM